MGLPLSQRLSLSSEAVALLRIVGDKGSPLQTRIRMSKKRLEILAQLSGLSLGFISSSDIEGKGKSLMSSLGLSVDSSSKQALVEQIKSNPRINDLISSQRWSGPKKKRILESVAQANKAYDVYRLVGADKTQASANHTFGIYEEVRDTHNEVYRQVGKQLSSILLNLIDSSPVPLGKGYELAEMSNFDKLADNRLSRQRKGDFVGRGGAAKRKLLASTGELYSLIAFTGEPIKFTVRQSRQDYLNSDRSISVGEGFTRKVLWHELCHSIEFDHPEVLEMAKDFLKRRLERSNGIRSLRDIYQDKWDSKRGITYSPNEYTIDDGAFTPYATKFYNNLNPFDIDGATATEVITMGVESLIDHDSRGRLAVNDPEHFEFIIGVIAHLHEKARGKNDSTSTN